MASIKDIAEKAHVSPSTVSIIINGKSRERKISQATEERVLQTMKDLNYIPNISAKTMRAGKNQQYTVALFCNFDYRNTMMTRLLMGIQNKIRENNDPIKVIIYPYQSGSLQKEKKHLADSEFHAAIVANADSDDLLFLSKNHFSVPIILYNRRLEGYNSVNVNDIEIGRIAAGHLYEKGYRRPAVISGNKAFPGSSTRISSFADHMQKLGIAIPEHYYFSVESSVKAGFELADTLIDQYEFELPDCFWCSSDVIALGLLNRLSSRKIKIPEKVGIISVGNVEPMYSMYNSPSLSVINIPIEQMGEGCYKYIKDYMKIADPAKQSRYYETKLYVRDSTNR